MDEHHQSIMLTRSTETPCIEYDGARNKQGYGVLPKAVNGSRLAHRAALAESLGRPLNGNVLHSCDNPPCVEPAHLREGTQKENIADAVRRGRTRGGRYNQASCSQGHPMTRENTRLKPNSQCRLGVERVCIICNMAANKAQSERRKVARHERGLFRNRKAQP